MKTVYLFLAGCLFLVSSFAQSTSGAPSFVRDSIESYIRQGLQDWQLPGLAVVIVKDGKVVLMKGYGVRDTGTKKPVDENTLFMIASNTKLFTASALCMLASEDKLSLDDPIRKFFPTYRLYDSASTKLASVRDMLSHHIGTKTFQGDFTFWNTSLSRTEIMRRMRYLKPPFHFRQEFGYCNSCFLTAGQIIPEVTGETWESFVQKHFLTPLAMNQTRILSTGIADQPNVATPYTSSYSFSLSRVPYDNWNNLAPAASIVSNVSDLSHWLFMQLDSGRYENKEVISWPALQQTRIANSWVRSTKSANYPTHFVGYGLGLFMADYAGKQVYWHTGGAGGMVSNVCFVPEANLGIAILTNNDNQSFFETLRYQILDAYLGVPYVNRSRMELESFLKETADAKKETNDWINRKSKNNKADLPLSEYTGSYKNGLYGNITIRQENNHLVIQFETKPDLSATLEYMDSGEWLLTYSNILYGRFMVSFTLNSNKVISLATKQNPFVEYDSYLFTKQ